MATSFEVVRFSASPVAADVALVELEGRFLGGAPPREAPTLLVDGADVRIEAPAVTWQQGAGARASLRAAFAVPFDLALEDALWGLRLERGLFLELPAPDVGGDKAADAQVRLARQVNALRAALDAERGARDDAETRLVQAHEAGDRDLAAARAEVASARERATQEVARVRAEAERDFAVAHERAAQEVRRARQESDRAADEARRAGQAELARAREDTARLQAELAAAQDAAERARAQERALAEERRNEEGGRDREALQDVVRQLEAARAETLEARREADRAREEAGRLGAELHGVQTRGAGIDEALRSARAETDRARAETERIRAEARDAGAELLELRRQLGAARTRMIELERARLAAPARAEGAPAVPDEPAAERRVRLLRLVNP
jgi:hypothetical protein